MGTRCVPDKTRINMADSFSEGMFRLSLTRLDGMSQLVPCGI